MSMVKEQLHHIYDRVTQAKTAHRDHVELSINYAIDIADTLRGLAFLPQPALACDRLGALITATHAKHFPEAPPIMLAQSETGRLEQFDDIVKLLARRDTVINECITTVKGMGIYNTGVTDALKGLLIEPPQPVPNAPPPPWGFAPAPIDIDNYKSLRNLLDKLNKKNFPKTYHIPGDNVATLIDQIDNMTADLSCREVVVQECLGALPSERAYPPPSNMPDKYNENVGFNAAIRDAHKAIAALIKPPLTPVEKLAMDLWTAGNNADGKLCPPNPTSDEFAPWIRAAAYAISKVTVS